MEKKLFLLDAYALIYRSYYAFINNPRINSKGLNTSAIFGFTNTLHEILVKEKPTHIAIAFDPKELTFRNDIFPQYKAQRPPTPEDIKLSIPYIKSIIDGFNIKRYEIDKYEADDVIGTLAKIAKSQGFVSYMMTPDKDYCQLVEEGIFLYKPRHKGNDIDIMGVQEVKEKFGIENPMQVIDILGLWGDASDNIPGAPGIGEKTSQQLIAQYGSIEGIYQNIGKLRGKQKENLLKFKEQVMLSKQLATIIIDVPLQFEEAELRYVEPNKSALEKLFEELEFNTLSKRIFATIEKTKTNQGSLFGEPASSETKAENDFVSSFKNINNAEHSYISISNAIQLKQLFKTLENNSEFAFQLVTSSNDFANSELLGISFSVTNNSAYFVSLIEKEPKPEIILEQLKPFFENPKISKVGHSLKYQIKILAKHGINLKGKIFDNELAHYVLYPDQNHNFENLTRNYLSYEAFSIENLVGKKAAELGDMRLIPIAQVKDFSCELADFSLQLKALLLVELEKVQMISLANDIEMPLIKVLATMELNGVKLDTTVLEKQNEELSIELKTIENKIFELAGQEFNIGSPKQLGEILFDKMQISTDAKKTKTEQYSTSEKDLSKLIDKHEIISYILEYRSLAKLKSTYLESLPKLINPETGKLHTHFNQASVATGRLSSTNPNLQNIPIRTEKGRQIRKAFVAENEQNILLAADYSQIELRIIAHISKEENMIEAFAQNADIHKDTASKIFNVPLSEVTKEMRSQAKSANFGIIYGISSFGLSENLGIKRGLAKEIIDNYMATYPEIKNYMDKQIALAREKEFVETISGRRRYLSDINSRNHIVRGLAERNAINAPIQGSAADIIKMAMIQIQQKFELHNLASKLILQVHDELVFDVVKTELETVKEIVKQEMENAVQISVPLTIELGTGNNWLEAH